MSAEAMSIVNVGHMQGVLYRQTGTESRWQYAVALPGPGGQCFVPSAGWVHTREAAIENARRDVGVEQD